MGFDFRLYLCAFSHKYAHACNDRCTAASGTTGQEHGWWLLTPPGLGPCGLRDEMHKVVGTSAHAPISASPLPLLACIITSIRKLAAVLAPQSGARDGLRILGGCQSARHGCPIQLFASELQCVTGNVFV